MKRRIFAALLAGALALSLTACGGVDGTSSSNPGGSSSGGSSQTDGSAPDGSGTTVGGSASGGASSSAGLLPDGSGSGSSSSEDVTPLPSVTLTLNRTSIELNKAGATFRLRYTADPDTDGVASFTSSDTKIATVAEDGTVKAVAPGKAVITVTYDGATATANVNCKWEESKPETPAPDASKPADGSSSSAPAANVNLADFYTTITGKYDFSFMMEADADMLSSFFAGLSNISTTQRVVYLCGMSPSPHGDFALVQVKDSKDVDAVKAILQARIDYMVGDGNGPGGAFYPMEQTMWEENARIAVNGNYVMLIAHDNCDDIVKEFNALF